MGILSAGLKDFDGVLSFVENGEMSVEKATRLVAEEFCKKMQKEDDNEMHDDYRMSNDFTEGYDAAIQDVREEAGLEPLEIDYETNKIIEKKPVKTLPKEVIFKTKIFTVKDEKVFTVKSEVSETKTMGEVLNVNKFKDYPKQLTDTFVCDECRGHFKGADIELKPFGKNFNMCNPMMSLKLVDATTGEIIGTSNTGGLNKDHDYYTLCCPKCHATHLWGMTAIDPRKVFEVK